MSENFDYRIDYLKVDELLPVNVQTDIITSSFNNGINRFLTKEDGKTISGIIGRKYDTQYHIIGNNINQIFISDDYTNTFTVGFNFNIYNSINSGNYTVIFSDYDVSHNRTVITIDNELQLTLNNTLFGFIGIPNTTEKNKVIESDIFRNAYQLQPLLYSSLAAENHITSIDDIWRKLEILGVDIERLDKWGKCEQFTFAPPIDIDKFVNYKDYYWTSDIDPNYITINNKLTRIQSKINKINLIKSQDPNDISFDTTLDTLNAAKIKIIAEIDSIVRPISWDEKTIIPKYQWIDDNKWKHKDDLKNDIYAYQAKLPIIEYFDELEINEWTFTKHNWMYRSDSTTPWVSVTSGPTDNELSIRFPISSNDLNTFTIEGNQTNVFITDYKFSVLESVNSGVFTVINSTFTNNQTVIQVDANLVVSLPSLLDFYSNTEFFGVTGQYFGIISPAITSRGDKWLGLYTHWMWVSKELPVPINHQQPINQQSYKYVVPDFGYGLVYDNEDGKDYGYDGVARFTAPINYILDTDDIQVYINGIRQYGTYTEAVSTNTSHFDIPKLDIDNFDNPAEPTSILTNCIDIIIPLYKDDTILIKVGPAVNSDIKRHGNYIRVYNENALGDIPIIKLRNLIEYRIHEQVKIKPNQYLNFDIYKPDGSTDYSANNIFKYKEDLISNVNNLLDIRTEIHGNNFTFENLLAKNNVLYCYKNNGLLNTVWQKCITDYIPKKINDYRDADFNGVWELPEPVRCNIYNECRNDVLYQDLKPHFNNILVLQTGFDNNLNNISAQPATITLPNKYLYDGGNIKIFNNQYSLLLSMMHTDIISFKTVLSRVKTQYANNLNNIKITTLKNYPVVDMWSILAKNRDLTNDIIYDRIISMVIEYMTYNTDLTKIFGDSTAYNALTNKGVKSWVATLPILGFKKPVQPILLIDPNLNINKIRHHDGHYSTTVLTDDDLNTIRYNIQSNIAASLINLDAINDNQPSSQQGALWLDSSNVLKRCHDGVWLVFDILHIVNEVTLTIENKLYEISKTVNSKIDINNIFESNDYDLFFPQIQINYLEYVKSLQTLTTVYDYVAGDAFTWNYFYTDTSTINHQTQTWAARWYEIYELQYGTAYPHLEPWKLQSFNEKPVNWDAIYLVDGQWTTTMWGDIKNGTINNKIIKPANITYRTYSVISVNDTGHTVGQYKANSLLPPFITIAGLSHNSLINSNIPPLKRDSLFIFGQQPLQERLWRESIDYNYDLLYTLFQLQPLKIINRFFNDKTNNINGLKIDTRTNKVLSHRDIIFHGTVLNGVKYISNNANQWFIHALRMDSNTNIIPQFIDLWTKWEAKLTYQTDSVINVNSLSLDNDSFYINNADYNIYLKKSPNSINHWLHSLVFSLNKVGEYKINAFNKLKAPLNDGSDWQFRLDTLIVDGGTLDYYDIRQYYITDINTYNSENDTNPICTFKIAKYNDAGILTPISEVNLPWINTDQVNINFTSATINSDQTYHIFKYNNTDRYYLTILNTELNSYNPVSLFDQLVCYTEEQISTGTIQPNDYDLKYNASTKKLMQYRLMSDVWVSYSTVDNQFIIPSTDVNIILINDNKLVDSNLYTIDSNKITLSPNLIINNLVIRLVVPNQTILEERHDSFYALNSIHSSLLWKHLSLDKKRIKHITAPAIITGVQNVINFIDGYAQMMSDNGFVFNDFERPKFDPIYTDRIIGWQLETEKFIDKVWVGFNTDYNSTLSKTNNIFEFNEIYDYIDVNPFKYGFWINTPQGIISNILTGAYKDIHFVPLVYDNNGNPISTSDNLNILRSDKITTITHPILPTNYIGGARIFIDFYEHIIAFNDYTTNLNLLYDSFLGLNTESIKLSLFKHYEVTKRPNLGGCFLNHDIMVDNLESSITNLSLFYDDYANTETKKHINDARAILGYNTNYLNKLDSKSKFLFWKGLLHTKGSNNSIDSYTQMSNLNRVNIDEIWSYKTGSYGCSNPIEQYVNIFKSDVYKNKIRYWFEDNSIIDGDNFTQIKTSDITRWKEVTDKSNGVLEYELTNATRYLFNTRVKQSKPAAITTYDTLANNTYYLKLQNHCEYCELFIEVNYGVFITKDYTTDEIIVPNYVRGTDMLSIVIDGIKQPYTEIAYNGTYISDKIKLPVIENAKKIAIVYGRGKLVKGEHYTQLRTNLIRFTSSTEANVYRMSAVLNNHCDLLDVHLYNIDHTIHDTCIVDTKQNITITPLPYFHPRLGVYNLKISMVDYITDTDPANYGEIFWNKTEIGTKWIDTADVGYYCYNDPAVYPNINDRIALWGLTTEWSHVTCYEWVESPIIPSEWETFVQLGTSINTINDLKFVGKPLTILYKRTRLTEIDSWSDWVIERNTYQIIDAYNYSSVIAANNGTISFDITLDINAAIDNYYVYVNEIKYDNYNVYAIDNKLTSITLFGISDKDSIKVIRFADVPTTDEINQVNPPGLVDYTLDYKYSTVKTYDNVGENTTIKYYFWVTNQISRLTDNISTTDIEELFLHNNNAYRFHLSPNKWVLTGLNDIIKYNNFSLQIIKNKALHSTSKYKENTHNHYNEWQLLRMYGVEKIPNILWVKLIESMIERKLDSSATVPLYSKIIFDKTNDATTRYGLNEGQTLGDSNILIKSIIDLLYDNNFKIVNRDAFFENYNFNNQLNIITTMNYIYNTFSSKLVNEIFFHLIKDTLSFTDELDGLLKTSMIALDCEMTMGFV